MVSSHTNNVYGFLYKGRMLALPEKNGVSNGSLWEHGCVPQQENKHKTTLGKHIMLLPEG